jgi:hypothetical protein
MASKVSLRLSIPLYVLFVLVAKSISASLVFMLLVGGIILEWLLARVELVGMARQND